MVLNNSNSIRLFTLTSIALFLHEKMSRFCSIYYNGRSDSSFCLCLVHGHTVKTKIRLFLKRRLFPFYLYTYIQIRYIGICIIFSEILHGRLAVCPLHIYEATIFLKEETTLEKSQNS